MRTGLAALEVVHLSLEHASAGSDQLLPTQGLYPVLRRLLLGICAIAVGNAEGALETAARYAAERYQGGDQIDRHPAVLGLLGEAASRVFAGAALLASEADQTVDSRRALWRALASKLRIPEDCCQAVTDCLQVLGGYGYMEDYRLEKRLRDAMTLKSLGIRADDLRTLCATADVWGWGYGA
jgi:alkylation response protein AidB-like acyl-CoA dehydrogenase